MIPSDEQLYERFRRTRDREALGVLLDRYAERLTLFAFGIDIPPQSCRGKGYGYEAFKAAIEYLASKGMKEIYTQTWSGNTRMIALAEKLGFREVCRKKDFREVRGEKFDGLTFVHKAE